MRNSVKGFPNAPILYGIPLIYKFQGKIGTGWNIKYVRHLELYIIKYIKKDESLAKVGIDFLQTNTGK